MTGGAEHPALSAVRERIRAAAADGRPLRIRGGGTKDFYGGALDGDVVDVASLAGIVAYAPGELVITARAGTPLDEIEAALARARPDARVRTAASRRRRATLGGIVATGFSGPRRAQAGAVRDFVLGVRIVDGTGEALAFGGQVIKNVAGFDVSRLMTGALGTLGVLTEISLKMPAAPAPRNDSRHRLRRRAMRCDSSTNGAASHCRCRPRAITDGRLWVRLSGAPAAIAAATRGIGGDEVDGDAFWRSHCAIRRTSASSGDARRR